MARSTIVILDNMNDIIFSLEWKLHFHLNKFLDYYDVLERLCVSNLNTSEMRDNDVMQVHCTTVEKTKAD
jgi:hypothetical protein